MGQVNSCSYHHLPTKHSEEGYCALCDQRFSALRGPHRNIPDEKDGLDGKDGLNEKSKVGKRVGPVENSLKSADCSGDDRASRVQHFRYEFPDYIFRCYHCTRFFYSQEALLDHINASKGDRTQNTRLNRTADASDFCGICKRSYACGILDHLNSALLHIQRPEISKQDLETERVCDCCVRCGICFISKEQKRKHFRDVEHHILHVQAEHDSQAGAEANLSAPGSASSASFSSDDLDDSEDLEYPAAALFPIPTTVLPSHAHPPPALISLKSSYAPELRAGANDAPPPLATRRSLSLANYGSGSSSSSVARKVTITEQFECPLCLENETDIASLPCGHVFGTSCIYKTLNSDPRCPLCRRYVGAGTVRRVQA